MSDLGKEKFKSGKQDWNTPNDLFLILNNEFCFDIDLAASAENTKCKNFIKKEQDSMKQTWKGKCWLNPPYGESKGYSLRKWVEKAYIESQKNDCIIVMLIPSRTNTEWWHKFCMKAKEVRFIKGRPKFSNYIHGLPLPLSIVIFEKHDKDTLFSSLVINNNNTKSLFEY